MTNKIRICSYKEAEDFAKTVSEDWAIISISGHENKWPTFPEKFCNPVCKLWFDDLNFDIIAHERGGEEEIKKLKNAGYIFADFEQIIMAIKYAREFKDKPLLIHCAAGISRSPAIGLVILYDRLKNYRLATEELCKICNPDLINPNGYIIRLGREVIGCKM